MMTKQEIAKTIIDICTHDASFCQDITGGDQRAFLSEITEEMSDKEFLFSVEKYLATFKVWGHLYFYQKNLRTYLGFHVRRYENSLFITQAEREMPFSKGDEIIAIDGLSIERAAEKFAVFFESDPPDRQSERWETVIAHAKVVTVRAEKTFDYVVRTDIERGTNEPSCVFRPLDQETYYLKLTNFFDEQDISSIVDYASKDITCTQNLIIDLRNNCGGNDTEFLPLLKFLLKKDDKLCGKQIFTEEDEILYTERNAAKRIEMFQEYLESVTSDEVRKYLIEQIEEQKKNSGKGFLPAKADEFLFPTSGTEQPEKVVVLTDCDCASSAESFVEIASRMEKVTVIGRPTMGVNDYANLAWFDFGEYVLHYPTSRSKSIDEGKGTRGKGIAPDIFIPWTPKHIFEDVDLTEARKWLKNAEKAKKL